MVQSGLPTREYEDHRRIAAAGRSFVTPAIITLVLYFVLWLPGLIANVVYWREASNVQRLTGHSPEGKGCLVALLWTFIILPIAGVVIFGIAVAVAGS
ncbi:MAG TPA: hypothetical protein VH475_06205 [Tepidisphaeraceae bacterium]|jgi:hypothetical protein